MSYPKKKATERQQKKCPVFHTPLTMNTAPKSNPIVIHFTSRCETGLATKSISFLFPFSEKSFICLEALGKHYFLPFLPATSSSPSRTLKGLFELTRRPSQALASCIAPGTTEIQGHHQVCRARRGGPRTP